MYRNYSIGALFQQPVRAGFGALLPMKLYVKHDRIQSISGVVRPVIR